jgi:hypothetical protein
MVRKSHLAIHQTSLAHSVAAAPFALIKHQAHSFLEPKCPQVLVAYMDDVHLFRLYRQNHPSMLLSSTVILRAVYCTSVHLLQLQLYVSAQYRIRMTKT